MKQWTTLLLVVLFLAGCSKNEPTYELIIGQRTIKMPVHDDPKLIQDDLLAAAEPLWTNLKQGESEVLQYKRTFPWNPGLEKVDKAKERFGDNAEFTATETRSGPGLRFFKGRNGENGAEDGDANIIFRGNTTEWSTVAELLKNHVFSIDMICRIIQGSSGQSIEVSEE